MKPEQLLESMHNIRPEFIEEAKPTLKRHGESHISDTVQYTGSGTEDVQPPEQYCAQGEEITMSNQPMIQRIMTGAVAAAACAVFVGGGIFIATQSRKIQTEPAASAGSTESIEITESVPNMLGGQGELVPVDPNPIRCRAVLRDNTRYYETPGAWDISGNNNTLIPITDQIPLLQEYELLSDGERIYTDHRTAIYTIDSYGNETQFLTIDTVCNTATQQTGTPDPEHTFITGIWHIWSDDTADAYAFSGSAAFEDDPNEEYFTFLETAVIDRSTGNVSYQYIPAGTDFDISLLPAPEQRGFYFHAGTQIYFAPASAENQADNSMLQQVFLASPRSLSVNEAAWYIQDEILYFDGYDTEERFAYYKHSLTDDGLLPMDPDDCSIDYSTLPQEKIDANEERTLLMEDVYFTEFVVRENVLYSVMSGEENRIGRSDLEYQNVENIFEQDAEQGSILYLCCTGPDLFFWKGAENVVQISLADLSVRELRSDNTTTEANEITNDGTTDTDNSGNADNTNNTDNKGNTGNTGDTNDTQDAETADTGLKCTFIGHGVVTPSAYNNDGTLVTLRDETDVYRFDRDSIRPAHLPRIPACYHAPASGGTAVRYCQIPDCTHSDWDCDECYIHNYNWLTDGITVYSSNLQSGVFSQMIDNEMLSFVCCFNDFEPFQGCKNVTALEMYQFCGDYLLVVGYYTPEDLAAEDSLMPMRRKLVRITTDGGFIDAKDLAADERVAVCGGEGIAYTYTNDHITLKYDQHNAAAIPTADIAGSAIQALIPERDRLVYLDTDGHINVISERNGTETIDAPGAENLVQVMGKIYFVKQTENGWSICSLDENNQVTEVLPLEAKAALYGYAGFYEMAYSVGNRYFLFNPSSGTVTEEIEMP